MTLFWVEIVVLFPLLDSFLCMFLPYAFRELAGAGTFAASAECGTSAACWRCRFRQETLSQLVAAHLSCWAGSKQSKGATRYELVPPRTGFPYKARSFEEDNLKIKTNCSNFGNLAFLSFAFSKAKLPWTMPGPHHYLLLSPRQTCVRGNLPFLFEKKKEEKIKIWSLMARYCLPEVGAAQSIR